MTHFGDLPGDKKGAKENKLGPGDIAVGHTGKNQMPTKGDKWTSPYGTKVNVYPSKSSDFKGKVSDVGGHDKHRDVKGKTDPKLGRPLKSNDWIDIWDPEKSKKEITDYGWISTDVDDKCPCPEGWSGD